MFRKSLFAAIIILLLFCMGCWNRREPEAYSYLTFLAIDKADNGQIKLGFLYTPPLSPVPTGIKPPESLSLVSTIEARSLFEGIRNSTSHLPARSFFGYVHAIIFSEDLAREGLSKYLDLIYRDHEIRKNAFVFITKGSSTPLVQMDSKVPEPPGRILEGLIASEERSQGKSRVVRLKDLQTELSGPGFDPVISVLQLWDEDGNKLVGSGEKIPKKTSVALNGSAVFKGDKLIGWMSSEESQTYLIGKGEMRGGLLVIPHPNSEEGNVSIEFGKGKQKLTAKLNNKQVVVNLKVSINGSVGEQIIAGLGPKKSLPLGDSDFYTELGDLLKDKIKADLMALIKKSQTELGVDIFGVGNYLSNRYPTDWNLVKDNWPEYYTNAVFNLEVKAAVKGSGTIDLRYPAIE